MLLTSYCFYTFFTPLYNKLKLIIISHPSFNRMYWLMDILYIIYTKA